MTLAVVIDALADRLTSGLDGVSVSDVQPGGEDDLPAVVIAVEDASQQLIGLGGIPRAAQTGSLEVTDIIDLSDPVLEFGEEAIDMIHADRLGALLAHGPVVDPEDTSVSDDDGPYELVASDPAGRQVSVDPDAGEVRFGQPLPATGTLTLTYRIGMWEVNTIRFSGKLSLQSTAPAPSAVANLSREVAFLLAQPQEAFTQLAPLSWGHVTPADAGQDPAHAQALRYRFDFELEQVSLPTGGGVIDRVAFTSATDDLTEEFDVIREGNGV